MVSEMSTTMQVATFAPPSLVPDLEMGGCSRRNWATWKLKWNAYATRAKLSTEDADIQMATLVSALPDTAIEAMATLPYENQSDKQDVAKVIALLEAEYLEQINEIYESYVFFTRQQEDGESISSYITELRRLASTCNFGNLSDRLLRDRIVCGVADSSLRRTLLSQAMLDLPGCIKLCKSSRTANAQAEQMTSGRSSGSKKMEDSFAMRVKTDSLVWKRQRCKFCGRSHSRGQCPAYGQVCSHCKKMNHFAAVCQSKIRQFSLECVDNCEKSTVMSVSLDVDVDSVHCQDTVNTIHQKATRHSGTECGNAIYATLHAEGCPVRFQLDTGASCNVIRVADLNSVGQLQLKPTNKILRMYDGSKVTPKGLCQLHMENPKTKITHQMEFVVINEAPVSLLGLTACQQLGLITIHEENIMALHQPVTNSINALTKEILLQKYQSVFDGGIGSFPGIVHLELDASVPPVIMPLRRVPVSARDRLEGELSRLEKLGVISKVTQPTDWVSGLVIAEKKDGSLRICIDPKPLNKALKRPIYPLPTMEDVLSRLAKAKCFSVCDVKNGFWHAKLDKQSSMHTTFATPFGRYRWERLPFGISPAPEIFQAKLDEAVQGLKGVTRIVDDLLIWGEGDSDEEAVADHDRNILALVKRAEQRNIKLKAEKLQFRLKEVCFAGYILSDKGHMPDPQKVEAISAMPAPTDITALRRFLGMASYLGKYVDGFSRMCEPLRQLTKDDVDWNWSHERRAAFESIKDSLAKAPVLAFFDEQKKTTLQCDASQGALGAALLQGERPVAYASRALSAAERN